MNLFNAFLFDTMDFDRKGGEGRWAQKGPTLFQVCVLFSIEICDSSLWVLFLICLF